MKISQSAVVITLGLLCVTMMNNGSVEARCDESDESWGAATYVGAAAGAVGAVVATPYVLGAAGFTAAGIAVQSLAASLMSATTTTGTGAAVIGAAQSVGAAGLGVSGTVITAVAGAVTGGKAANYFSDNDK